MKDTQTRAAFAAWLHDQLTARGYDLSGPRSGGKTRFAEHSGLSPSTVTRLLKGDRVADIDVFRRLAAFLRVPYGEVLVRAGVISADELGAIQNPDTGPRRITPEQAAAELGIVDDHARHAFVAMVNALQRPTPPPGGEENLAD